MQRPLYIWIGFFLGLALLVSAMGWISWTVLRLDRAENQARRLARQEENVRLALWRMDSMVTPLIAQESARPFFLYRSFYPSNRPYARMFEPLSASDPLQASPLLRASNPKINLHFQFGPDGELTSPQAPQDEWRLRAVEAGVSEADLSVAALRLRKFGESLSRDAMLRAISGIGASPKPGWTITASQNGEEAAGALDNSQQIRNVIEFTKRREITNLASANEFFLNNDGVAVFESRAGEWGMQPMWTGEMLLLTRRLTINGEDYVQGCWLNWPEVRASLLGEIRDLLPGADLVPVPSGAIDPGASMLTGLPVKLALDSRAMEDAGQAAGALLNNALVASLAVAWVCVILAAGAFAILLSGVMRLNERRGAFVSAVTHELRTPLTSLRMYTEMMTTGMIRNEEKVREYLRTMNVEIDRLGHLVENVLTYSRLERGRARGRIEALPLGELVDRVKHRLVLRAEQAGYHVSVELNERRAEAKVRVDITAIEQILFNLVDNACKYGRNGAIEEDRFVIHLQADRNGKWATLRVRDHGPGIKPEDAERLFKPFTKSARDAAHSAPGVGLGLALSRRLARVMGGDLDIDPAVRDGACFVLTLPAVG